MRDEVAIGRAGRLRGISLVSKLKFRFRLRQRDGNALYCAVCVQCRPLEGLPEFPAFSVREANAVRAPQSKGAPVGVDGFID